ncbi:efflux RND transporter periplasmic adaptor subunit [Aliikangiella coralliicola]|uniref:HlyD family efflux transporter periplasmic adaptor subunit n=1 Tax=Aliikangiella coralliicola TaxID=2592383 RepID=A0A545U964_9GAMM|nr:HlyD family efflux transporter periplasmic adaptor subunit [Aliikangiella coralliicola]TQV86016.1 HlyD family efflux transporter periplasmic adaptor subunit [Aliikangiella coralliicola]
MDIAVTKKKKTNTKRYLVIVLIALPVLFAVRYLWFLGQADIAVDRNTMVFGEVKRDKFTVSVRGTGVLVPENIQWLSATVEAKVEKLIVKAGNVVKKGDLIVELSNPQLYQQLAEAKWEVEAMEAETKAARVAQESALQQQKASVLNAKLDYESGLLEYKAHSELIETGAVSKLAFERSRLAMDQFKERWISSQKELKKMEENLTAQNSARTARLNQTKKSLERTQQQVDDLQVRATMDSIVLEVPLEAGQRVTMGANIAKLAEQGLLIAELQVPEIQIRDVATGQRVIIDTRNSKFEGVVSRVDPAVINGNVQVDVAFSETLPDDARPDLSVDGEIKITEIADALYVDRPLFVQSKSNSAFYKLSEDGQFAERVEVKVGYGSVNQIQILEGLQVGDKIVTSDPTRFETYEKFRIN